MSEREEMDYENPRLDYGNAEMEYGSQQSSSSLPIFKPKTAQMLNIFILRNHILRKITYICIKLSGINLSRFLEYKPFTLKTGIKVNKNDATDFTLFDPTYK